VALNLDPAALGAHSHALPRGPRVRLRLAQTRDAGAIAHLLAEHGLDPSDLDVARLLRADPRRRVTICATALLGGSETVVGVGSSEVGLPEPDVLAVDAELTDGLEDLLTEAVQRRAEAIAERAAA
jgi:hypothetical protein